MKVGITGVTGFLGFALAMKLLREGHEVRCLVRKTSNTEKLKGINVSLWYGDLKDKGSLIDFSQDLDIIIHCAALRGEKYLPYSEYYKVNVKGTKSLLEASMHIQKFIFISTVGVLDYGINLDEKCRRKKSSYYHNSKIEAEKLCEGYPNTIIIRPAIIYGKEDIDGMIFKLIRAIKKHRFLFVGNGLNRIHLVHIDNLAEGIVKCIDQWVLGEQYIIADEEVLTFKQIIFAISDALKVRIPRIKISRSVALPIGIIHQRLHNLLKLRGEPFISKTKVDIVTKEQSFLIDKAKSLGYKSLVSPQEGIKEEVNWLLENKRI